jgi:hypothetical protein
MKQHSHCRRLACLSSLYGLCIAAGAGCQLPGAESLLELWQHSSVLLLVHGCCDLQSLPRLPLQPPLFYSTEWSKPHLLVSCKTRVVWSATSAKVLVLHIPSMGLKRLVQGPPWKAVPRGQVRLREPSTIKAATLLFLPTSAFQVVPDAHRLECSSSATSFCMRASSLSILCLACLADSVACSALSRPLFNAAATFSASFSCCSFNLLHTEG